MKRHGITFTLFLIACAPAQTSVKPAVDQEAAAAEIKLPVDPKVATGVLDNGLQYIIRVNQKPENRAELRLALNVGSVLEEEDERGLAHFAEHMAFNGTRHFAKQELVDYLESIGMRSGADLNAATSFDNTVYMLTVPTDRVAVMEQAFQIMEDWAHGVSYEPEEIEKERGVVVEEWRLGQGAGRRMLNEQLPIILKDSRYAERLPIGEKAVLDTFHHETLKAFYRTWYRPELMSFVAVGDFEPSWIDSLIRVYFSRIPASANGKERVVYPVPDHDETLFAIATDPEATSNSLSIYYKQDVRADGTVASYRQSLMEGLYHSMFNQRLHELTKVAEPPYLYGYSSQGRMLHSKEFFVLGAGVANNGFDAGLEALLTEAERVRQFGFTESELSRGKKETLRGIEQAYRERDKSQSGGFASEYVRHFLRDEPIPGIEKEYELYNELVPGIELDEVNDLASHWAGTRNRVITANAPAQEGLVVPAEADLLAVFERVAAKQIDPYEDEVSDLPLVAEVPEPADIVDRGEIPEIGVTIWTLANGIRVFLKPTDFQNDEVQFTSYSPGGHSLVQDAEYVAATTASSVVGEGGVGDFDQIALQKKLAGKVVGVSPWIGSLQEGVSGSASPEDLGTMFELIYAYVTSPRRDSTAFQAFQTRMAGFIENRSAHPETAFGDTIQVTMAQYHHRARPWSTELLDEMDLDTSMAVYRDRFADVGDFTFFFVGNFTLEGIEPLVRTYLGGLPAVGREESWRNVGMESPTGVIEKAVYRGIEPKSQSRLMFSGPFEFDGWRNNFEFDAMTTVLEIKLRKVLREDLAGTYGVWVSGGVTHYPEKEYQISLGFGCDPERVDELTEIIFTQIDSLKNYGIGEDYITKVVEIERRSHEVNLKENGFWISSLESADLHGLDPRRVLRYPEMVDSLTVEAVKQAAQRYFDTKNYVRVVLYPEAFEQPAD